MKLFLLTLLTSLAAQAQAPYPKDTTSFPYTAKKADFWVGWFGGTGCKRHWDALDFEDASHHEPFDKCGKYAQVSIRYHKWVDYPAYRDTKSKFFAWPIKGDGILTVASCNGINEEVFQLTQYESCGASGKLLALCLRDGSDVTEKYAGNCR